MGPDFIDLLRHLSSWMAEVSAAALEVTGVALILGASFLALGQALWAYLHPRKRPHAYKDLRHRLARGILLGLELLVAADIITSVAVELDFRAVGVLALIVLIRTFLSFSLEVEANGRWPWQGTPTTEGS